MQNFVRILEALERHGVEYVVVGGVAAVLHGAPVSTFDLDALVRVSESNAGRLLKVFDEIHARFRGRPDVLEPTLTDILAGRHLLLATDCGPFDVLGVIGRGARFDDLTGHVIELDLDGLSIPVLDLDELIRQKQALGRYKDQMALRLLYEVARQQDPAAGG